MARRSVGILAGPGLGLVLALAMVIPAEALARESVSGSGADALESPHAKKKKKKPVKKAPDPEPAADEPAADAPADSGADAPAEPAGDPGVADDDVGLVETGGGGGGGRIDFSEAFIEGTGTKSGALYLYERAEGALMSLVPLRATYRDEMIRTVFSAEDSPPPRTITAKDAKKGAKKVKAEDLPKPDELKPDVGKSKSKGKKKRGK